MPSIEEYLIDSADELEVVARGMRKLATDLDSVRNKLLAAAVELDTTRQKGRAEEGDDQDPA
jgi:hypothetical protein